MTNRSYPRWSKHGHSELFYPHKNRWIFEVHHHSDGRFVAIGKDLELITFTTAEEAKLACEAKYEKDHARKVFDFDREPVERISRGTQKVILPCPVLNSRVRHGWLAVRWNPKFATILWDYANFDACYPECERFLAFLDQSNWDRELIRRLIEAGWQYHQINRTCMRWNQFRGVTHEIAQWALDTLPGVYQKACGQFEEASQLVSTADWVRHGEKVILEEKPLPLNLPRYQG